MLSEAAREVLMLDSDRLYVLIGSRVKEIREAQKPRMSQDDLAQILGLKRTSVTNIEKGNQKPTLDTLYRLCEHFGLDLSEVTPPVAEVTRTPSRPVVVGGKSQEVGEKVASLVERLRPRSAHKRR
jgi:DNA-binding XRE family transcriptional regulator